MTEKGLSVIWFVIFMLMMGYNILVLKNISMHREGRLEEIKMLNNKLNKLAMLKLKENKISEEKRELMRKFLMMSVGIKKHLPKEPYNKKVILPSIQGIISCLDPKGKIHRVILIDGKGYSEGEDVKGFKVEKITDKGVYLVKHKKKWFVSIPEVKFSVVQE